MPLLRYFLATLAITLVVMLCIVNVGSWGYFYLLPNDPLNLASVHDYFFTVNCNAVGSALGAALGAVLYKLIVKPRRNQVGCDATCEIYEQAEDHTGSGVILLKRTKITYRNPSRG